MRACAGGAGWAPNTWLTATRAATTAPTTRGISASSKPGIPRVNRKTATSSSSSPSPVVRKETRWGGGAGWRGNARVGVMHGTKPKVHIHGLMAISPGVAASRCRARYWCGAVRPQRCGSRILHAHSTALRTGNAPSSVFAICMLFEPAQCMPVRTLMLRMVSLHSTRLTCSVLVAAGVIQWTRPVQRMRGALAALSLHRYHLCCDNVANGRLKQHASMWVGGTRARAVSARLRPPAPKVLAR